MKYYVEFYYKYYIEAYGYVTKKYQGSNIKTYTNLSIARKKKFIFNNKFNSKHDPIIIHIYGK
jgi:hypothetical protein